MMARRRVKAVCVRRVEQSGYVWKRLGDDMTGLACRNTRRLRSRLAIVRSIDEFDQSICAVTGTSS